RRNFQPEAAETDLSHAFGSEEDGDRSGKTEVQWNERDLAIEAKHSNKRHTRIAPVCVLTRSCVFSKV
ncbi:hypothetical protein, partial [Escherichia coli]|uniref:hypothetical protein n=1 Tax=Escherichia coli TaxID=562 RepID=UPI001BC84BC5